MNFELAIYDDFINNHGGLYTVAHISHSGFMKFHYWNFFHNSRKRIMFSFILIIRKYAIVDALMAHYPQIERARYILIVNHDRSRTSEIEPKSSHSRVRFSLHRAWDRSGSRGEPAFRVVFVTRNSLRGHNDINYD